MKIETVIQDMENRATDLEALADRLMVTGDGLDLELYEAIGVQPWKLRRAALSLRADADRIHMKYLRLVEKNKIEKDDES